MKSRRCPSKFYMYLGWPSNRWYRIHHLGTGVPGLLYLQPHRNASAVITRNAGVKGIGLQTNGLERLTVCNKFYEKSANL